MKKVKTIKPYWFNDHTHQEVVDLLNKEHPVTLRYNEDLVNRIHAKYPLITKTEVSIIVKSIFQSFRDFMVLGKVLNFNNLFFNTKLHFFDYRKNGRILPSLKVRISTPPPLRKHE